jgi:hypothetical protein
LIFLAIYHFRDPNAGLQLDGLPLNFPGEVFGVVFVLTGQTFHIVLALVIRVDIVVKLGAVAYSGAYLTT